MILQEKADRVKYHDDGLNPIRAQIRSVAEGVVKEKKARVANEKAILRQIADESTNMQNDIAQESA